jgi:hypothetical protein
MDTKMLDARLDAVRAWGEALYWSNVDAQSPVLTDRRLVYLALDDDVETIVRYVPTPAEMHRRGYDPALVWAAAVLASGRRTRHAGVRAMFVRNACAYCGVLSLAEGASQYLPVLQTLADPPASPAAAAVLQTLADPPALPAAAA